jgi:hypothetical protein
MGKYAGLAAPDTFMILSAKATAQNSQSPGHGDSLVIKILQKKAN